MGIFCTTKRICFSVLTGCLLSLLAACATQAPSSMNTAEGDKAVAVLLAGETMNSQPVKNQPTKSSSNTKLLTEKRNSRESLSTEPQKSESTEIFRLLGGENTTRISTGTVVLIADPTKINVTADQEQYRPSCNQTVAKAQAKVQDYEFQKKKLNNECSIVSSTSLELQQCKAKVKTNIYTAFSKILLDFKTELKSSKCGDFYQTIPNL